MANDLEKIACLVAKQCREEGECITQTLAAFMLQTLIIGHEWQKTDKEPENIQHFTEFAVKKILERNNLSVITIKLQAYFHLDFQCARKFQAEQKLASEGNIQWLLHRISNSSCATRNDYESLRNDIITFVMMQEIVDQKYDSNLFKNVERAVLSVFPASQIDQFLHLSQREKSEYLYILASVANGVHLYNSHISKRKRVLCNVAEIATRNAPKLMVDLSNEFKQLEELIKSTQGILHYFYFEEEPFEEENLNFALFQSYLEFLHQYAYFLQLMMVECKSMTFRIFFLRNHFELLMKDMQSALTDESTDTIRLFSLYSEVSTTWKSLSYELLYMNLLTRIFQQMKNFKKDCNSTCKDQDILDSFENITKSKEEVQTVTSTKSKDDIQTVPPVSKEGSEEKESAVYREENSADFDRMSRCGFNSDDPDVTKQSQNYLKIITAKDVKNFGELCLNFQGFCPWSLVYGNGILCMGERNLGIVSISEGCFAFSTAERRDKFCKRPNSYLTAVMDIVRVRPQLLMILNVFQEFGIELPNKDIFRETSKNPIFICDQGSQTEMHPIRRFDYTYKWNQWDFRRQAFQYLDLQNRMTHSAQTLKSHFRRENFSQVYLPKSTESQTKSDKCVGTIKPGNRDFFCNEEEAIQ